MCHMFGQAAWPRIPYLVCLGDFGKAFGRVLVVGVCIRMVLLRKLHEKKEVVVISTESSHACH
jgi:hypothetical protein